MLVLSRKLNESIVIGDDVVVKVISIEKGVIKLGIDAPREITIIRNELLEGVKESNIQASKEISDSEITQLSKILHK